MRRCPFRDNERDATYMDVNTALPTWASTLDFATTVTTVVDDINESDVTGLLAQNILQGLYCVVYSAGSFAVESKVETMLR
jgi:hypothetical protein